MSHVTDVRTYKVAAVKLIEGKPLSRVVACVVAYQMPQKRIKSLIK